MLRAILKPVQSFFGPEYQAEVEQSPFTPDLAKLEEYFFQNVFIYNQFMRGCGKFQEVMEGHCVKLCSAFTQDDNYVMWMKDLGNESVTFALPIGPDNMQGNTSFFGLPARILGQVFAMRATQIKKLDELMENGIQYKRQRIKLNVPYVRKHGRTLGEMEVKTIPAWAYIGNMAYWSNMINPTSKVYRPVKHYRANADGDPYYFYSQKNEQSHSK